VCPPDTKSLVREPPSFDHASSLGRELLDESKGKCRVRILNENRIGQYAENAPGAIYWDVDDRKGVSPLDLVRRAAKLHPRMFRQAFLQLDKLEKEKLERIVGRVPPSWMSNLARQFTIELVCYNLRKLKEIAL